MMLAALNLRWGESRSINKYKSQLRWQKWSWCAVVVKTVNQEASGSDCTSGWAIPLPPLWAWLISTPRLQWSLYRAFCMDCDSIKRVKCFEPPECYVNGKWWLLLQYGINKQWNRFKRLSPVGRGECMQYYQRQVSNTKYISFMGKCIGNWQFVLVLPDRFRVEIFLWIICFKTRLFSNYMVQNSYLALVGLNGVEVYSSKLIVEARWNYLLVTQSWIVYIILVLINDREK